VRREKEDTTKAGAAVAKTLASTAIAPEIT
jgi:hypothetical protein